MELQLHLQNGGEKSQPYLSSIVVAVTMPSGRQTDSRRTQSPQLLLSMVTVIPWSHALLFT